MSARLLILAALLTTVIPILVGAGAFFVALPWWTDSVLSRDPGTCMRKLQFVVSDEYVGWVSSSDQTDFRNSSYRLLFYATSVALVVTLIEVAAFASASAVPLFWCLSGAIGSVIVLFEAFTIAWLAQTPLRRTINCTLQQHANERFALATQTMREIRDVARQIDGTYASMSLRARTNVLELGRHAVLERASGGPASAMVELIGIKTKSEHDLRCVRYLATLFANVQTKLDEVKAIRGSGALQERVKQIENLFYSYDLAGALEDARWRDAYEQLKQIGSAVGRLCETPRGSTMPESVKDAYHTLNVSEETPLQNIKAVVNAYRRVWHPDLARDEVELDQFKLRMQQINVAWDIIRKAAE